MVYHTSWLSMPFLRTLARTGGPFCHLDFIYIVDGHNLRNDAAKIDLPYTSGYGVMARGWLGHKRLWNLQQVARWGQKTFLS